MPLFLHLTKKFQKNLKKQPKKIQEKAKEVLKIFLNHEKDPTLRRHALKGKYLNYESIDVTGDVRIIIQPQTLEIIDIIDIGTHSQLY